MAAGPLHSVVTATSLQVRDGKRVVTDGPFAETREQLGGYYVVEAKILMKQWPSRNEFRRRDTVRLRFGHSWK